MAFCPSCGTQLPDGGAACPKCAAGGPTAASAAPAAGLTDNVAGMLAYVTIIPAIVFLVLEPYNKRRFIRFHAFQCIFAAIALTVLAIGLKILWLIPVLGWAVLVVVWPLVLLGELILWLFLLLKAYQGQMYKLPVIGDMAQKQADAM